MAMIYKIALSDIAHDAKAYCFCSRVVELLLKNDGRPSIRDHDGFNTLHYAAMKGHRLTLEMVCTFTQIFYM